MSRFSRLRSNPEHNGRAEEAQLAGEHEATQLPRVRLRLPLSDGAPSLRPARQIGPMPWIGAVLVLVALLGYLLVYSASKSRTAVLVTTQALQPGSVLSASDLRVAQLSGDSALISGLEPGGALGQVVGQRLVTGLPAGTPLSRSALSPEASSGGAQMTLAVSPLHALGGALEPGDRVSVLGTFSAGTGQAHTRAIARDLEILAVGSTQSEQAASTMIGVTVALPNSQDTTALALASENGKIDLVRESATSGAAIPEASETTGG